MNAPPTDLHITVNGEPRTALPGTTVAVLIASLGMDPDRVAIERNQEVIPRRTWKEATVTEGDKLEIVAFIGGGSGAAAASGSGAAGADGADDDALVIAGRRFGSRLLVGTGKYRSIDEGREAIRLSGAEIVTVALRRVDLTPGKPNVLDSIDRSRHTILPNTAGCYTAEEAIRTCRLARELGMADMVKLEVIGDPQTLFPDGDATLQAAIVLVKEGFVVLPYCLDDPILARKLEDAGCAAVMPLAAPIGSGLGIRNPLQHPHHSRTGEGPGDRRCRRRHRIGRRRGDGAGLRGGLDEHGHRRGQASLADGRGDARRRHCRPQGVPGRPDSPQAPRQCILAAGRDDRVAAVPVAPRAAPLIYVITDRAATQGRPVETVIAAALASLPAAGPAASSRRSVAVQLREKDLDGRALLDLARRLRAITAAAGVRLFVNDRADVALAVGADGVHLGGASLSVDDVHAISPSLEIARSTHTKAEVAAAAADPRISFVVFGPVFATPSKQTWGNPHGTTALGAVCGQSLPVVALGGVNATNAGACVAAGASGIACIRPIMSATDPGAALTRLFEAIEST